ncbi:ATP-binding protein [Pseudomonas viridiflava]|uniref:ATP-binding protein n=1 Tax=Pseudomonas viridiflava TaxID=33069 RepID=UPI00177F578F|nr:ATP-binding protein [Pseudomonas viridiflava]MBD8187785.1 ATP-binding protein [Pseudomonas viridiflava]
MTIIQAVRVEEKLIKLNSSDDLGFGNLFDVDSLNLILGKNGSGKTHLLKSLAHAVAAPDDDGNQVYFNSNRVDKNKQDAYAKKDTCAIYYTGLPFKRKFRRWDSLIDASPKNRESVTADRLLKLGEVAKSLGVNAKLTAVFGYSRYVFRSVLIPALKNASRIIHPALQQVYQDYLASRRKSVDYGDDIESVDNQSEKHILFIEGFLLRQIFQEFPSVECVLYLTVLEYKALNGNKADSIRMALSLMVAIGVVVGNSNSGSDYFLKLSELVSRTKLVISHYTDLREYTKSKRVNYFQIDDFEAYQAFADADLPIRIEWSELPSGLRALVDQFVLIDEAIAKAVSRSRFSVLLLVDEGDAYLHLDWQRRYISLLNTYLGLMKKTYKLNSLQLVLATHSPLLAADIPGDFITNLDSPIKLKSFAAPLDEVVAGSFESSSLGEFASKKINDVYRRAKNSNLTSEDRNLIEAIGDVGIRAALIRAVDL